MTQQLDPEYLSIRNLQKTYPKTTAPAVNDVNLDVQQGDLVALLGPSGCGKTTTLRMVAGLLEPTSGEIRVNGEDVVSTPVHKRGMGMVFQSYALFPHLTVEENVAFGLQMHKVPRAQIAPRTAEALDKVQLGHLRARKPAELSGGQQQRVALARALVIHPTLLLLDEPLSNLDAKLREAMRREIRGIQQESGTTTLFVTHDQDEALDMADRIAILNNGVIEQYDRPTAIYESPATKFVANFVGKANFLEVGAVSGGSGGSGSTYQVHSDLFGSFAVAGAPGVTGAASLVVRPHRVTVEPSGERLGSLPTARARVTASSYTGNVRSYDLRLDSGQEMRADKLSSARDELRIGDEAYVSFEPGDAHLVPEG
ncbi:ABC transporter ATP-binding protein [Leucobacter chromiiresistens]|uniref:ABC-type quaternary amine transporter n=1 Tax=Leucobacter chromiiresistens TaxID=1079994 RepID=A0A1H0XYN7_9MICO|nr:ABC transporter ATP-binding protein [Leucobacter chromiiresistens]SDQ07993.1 putative spermidine/putrescine transport system ATP-binding protein [Leucobacter chromiiresistens]